MEYNISSILERLFKLSEHGTRVRTEMLAGLTTFVTMAYIIFVNPQMMGRRRHRPGRQFCRHLPGLGAGLYFHGSVRELAGGTGAGVWA